MSRFFSFTILCDLFSCFFFRNLPCLCCLLSLAFYVLLCYLNLHWPSIFLLNNRLFYVFLFWLFYSSNKKTHTQKYKAKCLYKGCFPILYKVIISLLSFFVFFFIFHLSSTALYTKITCKIKEFWSHSFQPAKLLCWYCYVKSNSCPYSLHMLHVFKLNLTHN